MENLSLGMLASYLGRDGYPVDLLDCAIDQIAPDRVASAVDVRRYRVIGISILARNSLEAAFALARAVRAVNSDVHIVAGGKFPTSNADEVLAEGSPFDSVVRYDGERTFLELVRHLEAGTSWHELPNLSHRVEGKVHHNPNSTEMIVHDLDSVPFPDRRYLQKFIARGAPTTMCASRGCTFACEFCVITAESKSLWGRPSWRGRSAESIAEELEQLVRDHDLGEVWFVDDLFLGPMPRGEARMFELCDELRRRDLGIGFSFEGRSESVVKHKQLFLALRDAGLRRVFLGVESGDNETLVRLRKGNKANHHSEAIEFLRSAGIEVNVGFLLFDPFKGLPAIRREVEFLEYLAERRIFTPPPFHSGLQLLKETPIFAKVVDAGLFTGDDRVLTYDYRDQRVKCVEQALRWLFVARNPKLFETLMWIIGMEWRKREAFPGAALGPENLTITRELAAFYKEFILAVARRLIDMVDPWPEDTRNLIRELELGELEREVDEFTAEITFLARAHKLARRLELSA